MRKIIKKCNKLCVFLQSHKKNFSSCGFAFLKRIDYKGVTAFIAVGLFLLVKIIRDSAENPRPTKSLGDECAATGLFRYLSMERMQLYI